jgi:integrase/recombinase XerC
MKLPLASKACEGAVSPPTLTLLRGEAHMHEWSKAIATYLLWLSAGGASKDTIRLRKSYITRFSRAGYSPWEATTENLIEWMVQQGWPSPETKKCARASLRSFYEWAAATGRVAISPGAALPRVKVPRAMPRPTPDNIFTAALAHADTRERLMVKLGALDGLRRAEIAKVRGTDLIGRKLRIVGKGGHIRSVPVIDQELIDALEAAGDAYLFPGNDDGHLSPWWVGKLLSRLLGPGWTGHTLRHRAGTRGFKGTKDLRAVQEFLGHASVKTTQLYTFIDDDDMIAVVQAAS